MSIINMSHNGTTVAKKKRITLKGFFIETYNYLKRICHHARFPFLCSFHFYTSKMRTYMDCHACLPIS